MSLNAIFDPMVRAYFDDNDGGGADTGDLNVYVIPKSAVDTSKKYEIDNFVMYKADVPPPADDMSNGVFVNFSPGSGTDCIGAICLWNDSAYEDTREMGFGAIFNEGVPFLFWVTNPEIAESYGVEIGLYVMVAIVGNHIAILYQKA